MPRDNDKNNNRPRGPRSGPPRGNRDAGAGRGPKRDARSDSRGERKFGDKKFGDKKFGDRKFGGERTDAGKRPYAGKSQGDKPYGAKPRFRDEHSRPDGDRPRAPRFDRNDRPPRDDRQPRFNRDESRPAKPRFDRDGERSFKPRTDRDGERAFKPRSDRGEGRTFKPRSDRDGERQFKPRSDRDGERSFKPRSDRGEGRSFKPRSDRDGERAFKPRGERSEGRNFKPREDRGEGRSFKPRGDRDQARSFKPREDRGEGRTFKPREDRAGRDARPSRSSGSDDRKFDRSDRPSRGPRKEFGRGDDRTSDKPWQKRGVPDRDARESRPRRDDDRKFASREDRPARSGFSRPRFDRDDRAPRGRSDWQEHPRSERGDADARPRRENEDDSKIFAKRPAFGGRGAFREKRDDDRPARAAPKKDKTGERIAKVLARAGLCSRRDAEEWVTQGRVAVNGRTINSPALDITARDVVTVDGKPLPERERTRLFLYHKPRGLMTTHDDPEGRPTVFDHLPEGLPRLISIGRLDFNTEGLLLLTNDGGLARVLEHPDTGWLRRYRVRAHGDVTQAQLDQLKKGIEVDGVRYGPIDATLERDQGANVWVTFAIREGKNREVRNVMAHLGLEVNRLIRISYGPFQLGELAEAQVEEVRSRVLRDQLGDKIATESGALFDKPTHEAGAEDAPAKPRRVKPLGKSALINDSKGRRVLVTRSGDKDKRSRNEDEANSYGPPRRPQRGYKGKRDLKPRDL